MLVIQDNTVVKHFDQFFRYSDGQWCSVGTLVQPNPHNNVGAFVERATEATEDRLIDACTEHLKTLRPDLIPVLDWVRKEVILRNHNKKDPLCDVSVWRRGQSWVSMFKLELQHFAKFCPKLPENSVMRRSEVMAHYRCKEQLPTALGGTNNYGMIFRNITVQLPGHDSRLPLTNLVPLLDKLFLIKVKLASTQETKIVVLFPGATVRHFIDMTMHRFDLLHFNDLDVKMIGCGGGFLDLSNKNTPLEQFRIGRCPAFTLQNKDARGKIYLGTDDYLGTTKMKRKPTMCMTITQLLNKEKHKRKQRRLQKLNRGGCDSDDDDDSDDDSDEDDSDFDSGQMQHQHQQHQHQQHQHQPPLQKQQKHTLKKKTIYKEDPVLSEDEVVHKRQRLSVLQKSVDDNDAIPVFSSDNNGYITVGFRFPQHLQHLLLPEIMKPLAHEMIEEHQKEQVKRLREENKKKKKNT